jgi:imidazole glycerol-phosphate synthase subunit HisH
MLDLVVYGGGNLGSVRRCLNRLELPFREVDANSPPTGDRPMLVPGVGAFGAVADALARDGLGSRVRDAAERGTPFLGICVGLQLLLDESEETPGAKGLGLIPGRVIKLKATKVPQIGWNKIELQKAHPGLSEGYVYFVNSYVASPLDRSKIWYESDYEGRYCAALRDVSEGRHICAFQFHPEKSGQFGHDLLSAWYQEVA